VTVGELGAQHAHYTVFDEASGTLRVHDCNMCVKGTDPVSLVACGAAGSAGWKKVEVAAVLAGE
jgi:hypothetical protein